MISGQLTENRSMAEKLPAAEEDVYEIQSLEEEIPAEWRGSAVYELETPARCPYCREPLRSLRVVRLTRIQVAFTSTLPRGGRVIVCPQCERILSAELGGLIV
jgi:hypothetical protein